MFATRSSTSSGLAQAGKSACPARMAPEGGMWLPRRTVTPRLPVPRATPLATAFRHAAPHGDGFLCPRPRRAVREACVSATRWPAGGTTKARRLPCPRSL